MYAYLVVDLVLNHEAFARYIQIFFSASSFLGADCMRLVLFTLSGL